MSHRIRLRSIFWGATFFWFILSIVISPEFAGIDTYIFKEAGANLALGKGFVISLLPFRPDSTPELYALYPPLYPFLFGIYSFLFGIGPTQNTFFNLLIALSCAWLWFQLFMSFFQAWQGSRSSYLMVLILGLLLPTALLGAARDRPDNLSLALFLGSILLSTARDITAKRWAGIFLLCGLNATVSPFGALLHFLSLLILHRKRIFRWVEPKWGASAIALSALPLTFVIVLYAFLDATAFQRFSEHASKGGAGIGVVLTLLREQGVSGYFAMILSSLSSLSPQPLGTNVSYLLTIVLLPAYFLFKFLKQKNHDYLSNWFFLVALGLLPLLLFPKQGNYLATTRNVLLAGMLYYGIREERVTKTLIRLVTVILVTLFLTQSPLLFRDVAIRATNHASLQRATAEAHRVAALAKPFGEQTRFGVWPALYFLYKDKVNLVDLYWIPQSKLHLPRLLVLGYAESGDLTTPVIPAGFHLPEGVRILSKPDLPQPTKVFGIPISKSSNTWEGLVVENPGFRE